jgi:DNA polymerase-3 subunit gamma/tau
VAKALYRKYRSKSLDEIVGQHHVTDILARSLAQGRIAHAYLLTGPRGVGKTSIARILAHEINKLPYDEDATNLDIIEIDAASNNGVEDIRDLREKVQVAPVLADKKVYIIDEVHMLSKAAFNALLKTLEEPPEHAVFILATTDVDKLPATIISRVQRFSFRAITTKDAAAHLKYIAEKEKIKIDNSALELIAVRGDGSFRDSISLLDQLRSLADKKNGITRELVEQSLGLAPLEYVEKIIAAYEAKDLQAVVSLLDESDQSGIQTSVLVTQLIQNVRATIAKQPQLIPLLDQLLDVAKSSQPNIKLLTVLATHTIPPRPKSVALTAPAMAVSAAVSDLKQPSMVKQKPAQLSRPEIKISPQTVSTQPETDTIAMPTPPTIAVPRDTASVSIDFDWQKLIEYTREHFVAIYSVLSKCSYIFDGEKITLYTMNGFYKKKLDDSKYRSSLAKSLSSIGAGEPFIETIGTPPPPKDSTAAAVAVIMGGGEEIDV